MNLPKNGLCFAHYIRDDALIRRFFDTFLFEDVPASDRRPDRLYLDEVEQCDIYVGLFGYEYGSEDEDGLSPTAREFEHATKFGAHRLVFVKGSNGMRHPKMQELIRKAQVGLIRKRFTSSAELVAGLYAALVKYLERKQLIRWGPFDASPCTQATLDDLDVELMEQFVGTARAVRRFPISEQTPPEHLLEHLNLRNEGRLTNAAILLFGRSPQRFIISSEVRCAHFHGTEVAKPIPSYQVYKGTVFELVDQAVDFVLSKIDRRIGVRSENARASRTYEIPVGVVTEAIVNAVAHRDYTDNGSIQVMLFADRLEIRNPGRLPPPLTLESLRVAHRSVPANPLLGEALYLAEYIERMGTGTLDMIRRCTEAGLPEPEFAVTDGFVATIRRPAPNTGLATEREGQTGVQAGVQAGVQVLAQAELGPRETAMLRACARKDATRGDLQTAAGFASRTRSFSRRLRTLFHDGLLEMTIPDRPRSPAQTYRLTDKGRIALEVRDASDTAVGPD